MDVALYQPEIPPNTGNIARLCAATNTKLNLIHPLGFEISDRTLKRAGLDYWEFLTLEEHADWNAFEESITDASRFMFFSKKADKLFWEAPFGKQSILVFGKETKGLPDEILELRQEQCYRIPMPNTNVRSLNLSTSVGIVLYEALRQTGSIK